MVFPSVSAPHFFSIFPPVSILFPFLRRTEAHTLWSSFFLSIMWSVNCILGIPRFCATIHLPESAYHVCSFVTGLPNSGCFQVPSICLRTSWSHCSKMNLKNKKNHNCLWHSACLSQSHLKQQCFKQWYYLLIESWLSIVVTKTMTNSNAGRKGFISAYSCSTSWRCTPCTSVMGNSRQKPGSRKGSRGLSRNISQWLATFGL